MITCLRAVRNIAVLAMGVCLAGCGGDGTSDASPTTARGLTPNTVDLAIDTDLLRSSLLVQDVFFPGDSCSLSESLVGGPGIRRLVNFSLAIINMGDQDLLIGDPSNPKPPLTTADFVYDTCHQHFHFANFTDYRLRTVPKGVSTHTVALGHKEGYFLTNVQPYFETEQTFLNPPVLDGLGISSGWADIYTVGTPGQWVDVTGVPAGDYELVVTVNASGRVVENHDSYPDVAIVPVHLPDPNSPLPVQYPYDSPVQPFPTEPPPIEG